MQSFNQRILSQKLIPVVSLPDVDAGMELTRMLTALGLNTIEVTFRTKCAAPAIEKITRAFPRMLVLAGTIVTPDQADAAARAGAHALVSPGCDPSVIRNCSSLGLPVIPGVATPSEIQTAMGLGLTRLKFFPAELSGGVKMVKTLLSVYRDISFMPTGGITEDNLLSYLRLERVFCCGGTWLAPEADLCAGNFPAIKARVKNALALLESLPAQDLSGA